MVEAGTPTGKASDGLGISLSGALRIERWLADVQPRRLPAFDKAGIKGLTGSLKAELATGDQSRRLADAFTTFYVFYDPSPIYDDFQIGIYGGTRNNTRASASRRDGRAESISNPVRCRRAPSRSRYSVTGFSSVTLPPTTSTQSLAITSSSGARL